jgi:hypothetical protein
MSPQSSVTHFDKQIIYAIFRGKMITILSGKLVSILPTAFHLAHHYRAVLAWGP